ncbi:hypothetical protein ILUMI_25275 [Ignelater luminosus]|uniref:Cyclin-dependent kinase 2-interacting protein n=1 Tax=Ignelater luminosus TaxID=2038154 RepID=A0A8K0C5S5_IGNLU|nr:hypothetical protein ILUMI_25275 [Ignelater luminosus]
MDSSNKTLGDGESTKCYSPVILPDNSAISPQKNLTGLPRVAKDIASDVYSNIQNWNENHIKGANITKSIAQLKTNNSKAVHPDGLESLTNALYEVVQKLTGIAKALEFLASQMNALVKVHKKPTPLFLSLSNNQLAALVENIAEAYQSELKIKEHVLENIAHTKDDSELMFYAVSWTHQKNITNDINLKLETLLTETGHRKIT